MDDEAVRLIKNVQQRLHSRGLTADQITVIRNPMTGLKEIYVHLAPEEEPA